MFSRKKESAKNSLLVSGTLFYAPYLEEGSFVVVIIRKRNLLLI